MRLELEPEDEARRQEVEDSWSPEEKLKRLRGATVAELVAAFYLAAEVAERQREQQNRGRAKRKARAKAGQLEVGSRPSGAASPGYFPNR